MFWETTRGVREGKGGILSTRLGVTRERIHLRRLQNNWTLTDHLTLYNKCRTFMLLSEDIPRFKTYVVQIFVSKADCRYLKFLIVPVHHHQRYDWALRGPSSRRYIRVAEDCWVTIVLNGSRIISSWFPFPLKLASDLEAAIIHSARREHALRKQLRTRSHTGD